jgi:DNA-directed RNA polymerase specialized sigma24 family protein
MAAASPTPPARSGWTTRSCHEDIFVARYEWLRHWALRLAGNVTDADDLLHDAFLQFVVRRRDLSEIDNVDAYLYGMLRRLRLSKRRALLRAREDSLAALDYDTAALSLRATDPRDLLRLQQELRQVCAWACRRKNTSKSGSVLLLRFFHGFFPGEIARILKCPLRGANDWLRIARREVRTFLADPPPAPRGDGLTWEEPLDALRSTIWASRPGACLDTAALTRLYAGHTAHTVSCRTLAHIVACRECLAQVSVLLGMRGPGDRDPHDMLGQDTSWRMARTVAEHVPRALRVAVNGLPLGGRRIDGDRCTFTLASDGEEPIEFVEVFSEQGVRLLLHELTWPAADRLNRSDRVEFAHGRSLSVSMHFDRPRPLIRIDYNYPTWAADADEALEPCDRIVPFGAVEAAPLRARVSRAIDGCLTWPRLRRAAIALTLGLVLTFATRAPWHSEPLSAAQLLATARGVEMQAATAPDLVVHRVLRFEERVLPARVLRARRRVDVWHHAHAQVAARRLYDEHGRLVRGVSHDTGVAPPLTHASAWMWEPSAEAFALIGGAHALVDELADRYVLRHAPTLAAGADGLVEATLVMAKEPLRPIEQTLVVRERGELREFRIAEAERAAVARSAVPDGAFEPEREIAAPEATVVPVPTPQARSRRDGWRPVAGDFEIDALFAAHRLNACLDTALPEAGDALSISDRVLREAEHLDALTSRWPADAVARLDADRAAAWQDVVRDHARRFRREVEALRRASSDGALDSDARESSGTLPVHDVASVRPAVVRLLALAASQHGLVRAGAGARLDLGDDLARAYAQALWFDEPWTMPAPPHGFGIVSTSHHMSVKTP